MPRKIAEREDVIPVIAELFRERGFAGTSLSEITERSGLGKGSLYHFFPGGKEEMGKAVLDDVASWFEYHVFTPLREGEDPYANIDQMFKSTTQFFHSGRRICLVGVFALDDTRDRFNSEVQSYFGDWTKALTIALRRTDFGAVQAREIAEDIVAGIQGALVLARSQNDPKVFTRAIKRLRARTRITQAT